MNANQFSGCDCKPSPRESSAVAAAVTAQGQRAMKHRAKCGNRHLSGLADIEIACDRPRGHSGWHSNSKFTGAWPDPDKVVSGQEPPNPFAPVRILRPSICG